MESTPKHHRFLSPTEFSLLAAAALFGVALKYFPEVAIQGYPLLAAIGAGLYFVRRASVTHHDALRVPIENKPHNPLLDLQELTHDLRSPLSGIKMACEQLARDPENKELAMMLSAALPKQVDQLLAVTHEISKISKSYRVEHQKH